MSISRWGRRRTRPTLVLDSSVESLSRSRRKGLQRLLADYLQCTQGKEGYRHFILSDPSERMMLEKQLLQIFNDDAMAILRRDGYDFTDVDLWAWILTAKNSDLAATRLWTVTNAPHITPPRPIPDFLFHLILRRIDWTAQSLRLVILHAWSRLGGQYVPPVSSSTPRTTIKTNAWTKHRLNNSRPEHVSPKKITESMVIFVRLLRHARKIYPEAGISIAALLAHNLTSMSREARTKPLESRTIARLTFLYNSALSLLSYPSSMRPYQSTVYQQRAQFNLLRSMNEFEPPLVIDREGYRAVTRVQLAHKKTIRERDWASMKARSWPPWKEDRLGLDTGKGPEYGVSRAGESMLRLEEAGYSDQQWENSARVLAGWDTDESPTIQTRTLLSRPIMSRRAARSRSTFKSPWQTNIWAARIRATRTVDEAWACFLAYKDDNGPASQDVYYAMFEKLVFEDKRLRKAQKGKNSSDAKVLAGYNESETALPGDSPMVYEKPGPREAIYVRTSPPGPDEFFDLTLTAGIRPAGRFLAFMLKHASTFQSGLRYLRESALPPRVVYALLNRDTLEGSRILADIQYLSEHTFAAFIHFLCRFAPAQSYQYLPVLNVPLKYLQPGQLPMSNQRINPLLQAFRLLHARRPFYRPPWNSLLSALARSGASIDTTDKANAQAQDILVWNHIRTVLRQMDAIGLELDFAGFQIVCVGLEKGIFAAATMLASSGREDAESIALVDAEHTLQDGLPFLKGLFKRLVSASVYGEVGATGPKDLFNGLPATAELLPRLLEVPSPAQLHAFIRVLGLREDYTGIQALIEWMSQFAPELQAVADEALNGRRLLRRCFIAARVFLEQSWILISEQNQQNRNVDEEQRQHGHPASEGVLAKHGQLNIHSDVPTPHVLQRVYEIMQKHEDWGEWPTDEEVVAYCRRTRR